MAKLFNRVAVNTTTTGSVTVTLGSAVSGAWLTPSEAGVANGDVVTYAITEGSDFELGRGTYTSSGTTLSRDTVIASKIGGTAGTSKMDLDGDATVVFTAAAQDLPESGSNANGRYVKFPDGTMLCTHAMKATYSTADRLAAAWTFPHAFADTDAYSWFASMQTRDPDNVTDGMTTAKRRASVVFEVSHSASTLNVAVDNLSSLYVSGDYVWLSLMATGRWY